MIARVRIEVASEEKASTHVENRPSPLLDERAQINGLLAVRDGGDVEDGIRSSNVW